MSQSTLPSDRHLADPVVEAYKVDIDRSLLQENLERTPAERVENLEALQAFAAELRRAGRVFRGKA